MPPHICTALHEEVQMKDPVDPVKNMTYQKHQTGAQRHQTGHSSWWRAGQWTQGSMVAGACQGTRRQQHCLAHTASYYTEVLTELSTPKVQQQQQQHLLLLAETWLAALHLML
jgi:hypothetical protein